MIKEANRIKSFRSLILVLLLSILISSCDDEGVRQVQKAGDKVSGGKVEAAPSISRTKGEIDWIHDLSKGLKSAVESNKPVMIDFYADWCGWCKRLDNTTYSDSEVVKLSDKFVCIKVNTDKNQQAARRYGISGLPTIVFLRHNGEVIERIVGYRDSTGYIKILSGIIEKL